ncbi:uncharacterized protein LOC124158619 [Ischnura elegans]|uniref:uncharacterized protein LOC124158619 n=1 Tax=Ischnura elegans TaxID=197161 RepID=UPI001ED890E3|nr:uncharacterized protein LOC124158619 [Ischnura elegans]
MSVHLSTEDCETAVRNFMRSANFILEDYKVKPLSDKTVGFMGRHLKLTITASCGGVMYQLPFFAKMVPITKSHRSFVVDLNFFSKEVTTYNTLVPKFNSCLPSGISFPVPQCFFIRGTVVDSGSMPTQGSEDEEVIILEDLTSKGFRTLDHFPPLDVVHCEAVLRAMARFHAASILLEDSCRKARPDDFEPVRDLFSGIKENFLVEQKGHVGYEWARNSAESVATAVFKMWPEKFQDTSREKVLETLMGGWSRVFEMAKTSPEYPNVVCHGDLWTNNIMFKYERDASGMRENPVDVVFVDLQLVRYAPPILDILLFLHVCTRREFRDRHIKDFLKFYYGALGYYVPEDTLKRFMPFGKLLQMCDRFRDFGRVMSTAYLPIILAESDLLVAKREKTDEPLNIDEVMLADRGEQMARNCKRSKNYSEWITNSFQECLVGLNLWR